MFRYVKNLGFVNKATEAKVNAEKEKLASYTEKARNDENTIR